MFVVNHAHVGQVVQHRLKVLAQTANEPSADLPDLHDCEKNRDEVHLEVLPGAEDLVEHHEALHHLETQRGAPEHRQREQLKHGHAEGAEEEEDAADDADEPNGNVA